MRVPVGQAEESHCQIFRISPAEAYSRAGGSQLNSSMHTSGDCLHCEEGARSEHLGTAGETTMSGPPPLPARTGYRRDIFQICMCQTKAHEPDPGQGWGRRSPKQGKLREQRAGLSLQLLYKGCPLLLLMFPLISHGPLGHMSVILAHGRLRQKDSCDSRPV